MRFVAVTIPSDDPDQNTERVYVSADHVIYVEPSSARPSMKALYDTGGKPVRGPKDVSAATVVLVGGKYLIVVHDDAPYSDATPIEVVESVINKLNGEAE